MPRSVLALADFIDLTVEVARAQWRQIQARHPRGRQEAFLPVETILCFGLFRILNPHGFGGRNMHTLPAEATILASTFRRTPGSITSKMLNLDGSRQNAQLVEPMLFVHLSDSPDQFAALYRVVVTAARDLGLGADRVPDCLGWLEQDNDGLLGQDELGPSEVTAIMRDFQEAAGSAPPMESQELERLVLHKARLLQHRFAKAILSNYDFTCAFCGVSPRSVKRRKMLLASHIKPWAASDDGEKMAVQNGLAACPVHDRAFDGGLLSISDSMAILIHPELAQSLRVDDGMTAFFGSEMLAPKLIMPDGATPPGRRYLEYHRREVFGA